MIKPDTKVAIIMNAGDVYGDEKRPTYLVKEVEKFKSFGFEAEELDLRNYFKTPELLTDKLDEYGAFWVMGGNSFVLRRAMRYSGFDKLIVPLIKEKSIVYAGFSAGSVVATKSLKGIDLVDDPKQVPADYTDDVIWNGLGLVDFSIAPHYKSDHPESEMVDDLVKFFQENDIPYRAISDGQAIVVIDDKSEIIG
jgi:dipeptidase E